MRRRPARKNSPASVAPVAVACAVTATLGMAAATWAYRESAGEPSGDWLIGAAGLYVTSLAWAATITARVSVLRGCVLALMGGAQAATLGGPLDALGPVCVIPADASSLQ